MERNGDGLLKRNPDRADEIWLLDRAVDLLEHLGIRRRHKAPRFDEVHVRDELAVLGSDPDEVLRPSDVIDRSPYRRVPVSAHLHTT